MKIDLRQIIERYNRLEDRLRFSIFGIFLLMVFMLDMAFIGLRQYNAIGAMHDQIKALSSQTAEVLNDKQRINQLKKSLEDTRSRFDDVNNRLRSVQDIPNILAIISRVAYDNNVKIDKLIPLKNQQEAIKTDFSGRYVAAPINVVVHCPYHRFGRFLNKLEGENFYFFLRDMVIARDEQSGAPSLSFSLTIGVIVADKQAV